MSKFNNVMYVAASVLKDITTVAEETANCTLYTIGSVTRSAAVSATLARKGTQTIYEALPASQEATEAVFEGLFGSSTDTKNTPMDDTIQGPMPQEIKPSKSFHTANKDLSES
jgi:hypothetical protein